MNNLFDAQVPRRDFLKWSLGTIAAGSVLGASCAKQEEVQQAKVIPVGLQLYSVRKECEKDLPGTIAAVAKMGYQGVEFAGYYNYTAEELRKMLDDNGLKCCGTHIGLDTLMGENFEATVEFNKVLGNKYLIIPWIGEEYRNSKQAWLDTAKMFDELAAKAKPHGMLVGYHNHDVEFKPIEDEIPWDLLFGNTTKDVVMQFDTGNAMMGGGDAITYLKRYPGRAKTIHLKEYSATNPKAILGEGDIKWKEVFELCETIGGTEWYIVEEEKDVYPPLECVELCLKNFNQLKNKA